MLALLAWLFGFLQITDVPIEETPIESMPPDPFGPGDGLPPPDTPFVYTGSGSQPVWSDVYDSAQKDYLADPVIANSPGGDAGYQFTIHIGQVAIRSMLRAASGFINRAYDDANQNTNLLSLITDAEFGDIVGRINRITRVLNQTAAEVNAIVQWAIPSLQAQILQLKHDLPLYIEYAALSERSWVIENIFKPLYAEMLKVQPAIDTAVAHEHVQSQAYTDTAVAALGLNVLKVVAPMATALKTLQAESEQCTQPMCATMGPNTNLGKFLKGLNIAADAALIAALLQMTEADLAGFIHTFTSHLAQVVGDVEQFTGTGGETVAGLIKNATADLI